MANIFRVTLTQLLFSQTCQNVLHFTGPSSDPLQMSALADELVTSWIGEVKQTQAADVSYVDIGVTLLESQFPAFHKTVNIEGVAGGQEHDVPFLASIWRLRTAFQGRKGRGRVYICGMTQDVSSKGLILAPTLQNWSFRADNILSVHGPNGSSSFRLQVCSPRPPFDPKPVTSIGIAPTWGHQRRRNIGIGI
jgi:hypothetical protein